jgi:hypothetical protein
MVGSGLQYHSVCHINMAYNLVWTTLKGIVHILNIIIQRVIK